MDIKSLQNHIAAQLQGKLAGTVLLHADDAPVSDGTWLGDYFALTTVPSETENHIHTVVISGTLRSLSIIYIQAPHDILGALIGKGGSNIAVLLNILNTNGFAADRISFKDESLAPPERGE